MLVEGLEEGEVCRTMSSLSKSDQHMRKQHHGRTGGSHTCLHMWRCGQRERGGREGREVCVEGGWRRCIGRVKGVLYVVGV